MTVRERNDSRCDPRNGLRSQVWQIDRETVNESQRISRDPETTIEEADATGKTEGTGCCVCVTVPHRALTAPRRVASLKSRRAPTCPTRSNGDWPLLSATAAIGTPTELSENFPRYIVRFISPTSTCSHWASRGEKSGIRQTKRREKLSKERRYRGWIHRNFSNQN
ncbi:Uncharacterized protein DBV15_07036 [Temnothorax longispinosus]|uniref:Uncharacterized protein n=1 Tax=Temnothorax longispinosus TaxID=300112 RepID=A0A4S2JDI9_9HYME|nr:Uncharacterized protein DBV15_07036 [Temnothorax longispinosus]